MTTPSEPDEEVDEITELAEADINPLTGKPRTLNRLTNNVGQPDKMSLDEFLHEVFDTSVEGEKDPELPTLQWLRENYRTTSARIRHLLDMGVEVKRIAKHLNIRYQFVRNIKVQALKRGPNEGKVAYNEQGRGWVTSQINPEPEPDSEDDWG